MNRHTMYAAVVLAALCSSSVAVQGQSTRPPKYRKAVLRIEKHTADTADTAGNGLRPQVRLIVNGGEPGKRHQIKCAFVVRDERGNIVDKSRYDFSTDIGSDRNRIVKLPHIPQPGVELTNTFRYTWQIGARIVPDGPKVYASGSFVFHRRGYAPNRNGGPGLLGEEMGRP